jgi:hypothetical protein
MKTSRRRFLGNMTAGAGWAALAGSTVLGASCSGMGRKYSYTNDIIDPQNMSPAYHWTDIMLQTVRDQAVNPPRATRAFAMGHMAGFMAVNGIDPQYNLQNNYGLSDGPRDADPAVAYGVACSYAMADAFQSSFIFDRMSYLDRFPDNGGKARGIEWGKACADAIIKARTHDGAEPSKSAYYLDRYSRRTDSLRWRPTGPFYGARNGPAFSSFNRGLLPGWGAQKPWVMNDISRFRAQPFMDPRSPEFADQYYRVKLLGGMDSITRSTDQTQIAFFWEDGPRGITPPGHWQLLAMQLLEDKNLNLAEQSKAFALMSLAQADGAISCWDSKFEYDILRPETAIRMRTSAFGNNDPRMVADPNWASLIPTPPFPAYTSGHSTFSAASAKVLALCLGQDDIRFSGSSPDLVNWPHQLTGVTRSWPSLSACADEGGISREYGGIHWAADNTEGLRIGRDLGQYVVDHAIVRRG